MDYSVSKNEQLVIYSMRIIVQAVIQNHFDQLLQFYEIQFCQRAFKFAKNFSQDFLISLYDSLQLLVINLQREPLSFMICRESFWQLIRKDVYNYQQIHPAYLSFLKALSIRAKDYPIEIFYNVKLYQFPLVWKPLIFSHSPDSLIRTCVQTIVANLISSFPECQYFCKPPFSFYFIYESCRLNEELCKGERRAVTDNIIFFDDIATVGKNNHNIYLPLFAWFIYPNIRNMALIEALISVISSLRCQPILILLSRIYFFQKLTFNEKAFMEERWEQPQSYLNPSFWKMHENELINVWKSSFKITKKQVLKQFQSVFGISNDQFKKQFQIHSQMLKRLSLQKQMSEFLPNKLYDEICDKPSLLHLSLFIGVSKRSRMTLQGRLLQSFRELIIKEVNLGNNLSQLYSLSDYFIEHQLISNSLKKILLQNLIKQIPPVKEAVLSDKIIANSFAFINSCLAASDSSFQILFKMLVKLNLLDFRFQLDGVSDPFAISYMTSQGYLQFRSGTLVIKIQKRKDQVFSISKSFCACKGNQISLEQGCRKLRVISEYSASFRKEWNKREEWWQRAGQHLQSQLDCLNELYIQSISIGCN